ncbi:MAG TPA: hypothetical protein VKA60_16215 [Blastocatellia bacterium]|nr:hypothetical protein [Blastocatellia bacterium]
MTIATTLLKSSLDCLSEKLGRLANDPELDRVREALAQIARRGLEPDDFVKDLKELAEAVIEVRKKPGNSAALRELPVPPYDLWLPFKAKDWTCSDAAELADAVRIFREFNHKVSPEALSPATPGSAGAGAKLDQ